MSKITIYGIPNCGSVQKTIDWFTKKKIPYAFHNYKKEPIDATILTEWCQQVGWEKLVNTKGTTWRGLPEKTKSTPLTEKKAIQLMQQNNSLIKRPVIAFRKQLLVGFDEAKLSEKIKN